jgi:hypothetical protein
MTTIRYVRSGHFTSEPKPTLPLSRRLTCAARSIAPVWRCASRPSDGRTPVIYRVECPSAQHEVRCQGCRAARAGVDRDQVVQVVHVTGVLPRSSWGQRTEAEVVVDVLLVVPGRLAVSATSPRSPASHHRANSESSTTSSRKVLSCRAVQIATAGRSPVCSQCSTRPSVQILA